VSIQIAVDTGAFSEAMEIAPRLVIQEIEKAVKTGLVNVQRDARRNHPGWKSQSGALARSVKVDFRTFKNPGGIYLDTGVAPYAGYVHDGTRPHKIRAKNKKTLFFRKGADKFFPKVVNHPGTKPTLFLTNAVYRNVQTLTGLVNEAVGKALNAAVKKV